MIYVWFNWCGDSAVSVLLLFMYAPEYLIRLFIYLFKSGSFVVLFVWNLFILTINYMYAVNITHNGKASTYIYICYAMISLNKLTPLDYY